MPPMVLSRVDNLPGFPKMHDNQGN
jgi:hypothetical protein